MALMDLNTNADIDALCSFVLATISGLIDRLLDLYGRTFDYRTLEADLIIVLRVDAVMRTGTDRLNTNYVLIRASLLDRYLL